MNDDTTNSIILICEGIYVLEKDNISQIKKDNISRIKILLKAYPKGLTITDISSKLKMNRNSAAKYLEVLLISGQVETRSYGTAHVFFLTHRIPISAMLSISSDLVVALDESHKVVFCNDNLLTFFGITRDHIVGHHIVEIYCQDIQDITFPDIFADILVNPDLVKEIPIKKSNESYFFRIKGIKTVFDDGCRGITLVMEDVTKEKKYQLDLEAKEARYRGIVEDQTELICRFLPDGTHVFVNEAYCKYFGKKCTELIGKKFRPEIPPEDQAGVREHFASLKKDHPVSTTDHRIIILDGTIRWQWWTDRAIFDAEGQLIEYQSVGRDITGLKRAEENLRESERKRAEDAIRNSENYLQTIFNATHSGLVIIDPETHTVFDANSTAVELIGTEKSNIVGSSCKKFFCFAENDQCPVTDLGQKLIRSESCLFNAKGEKKPVLKTVVPVQLGGHSYLLESFLDITERKRAEEALRESEDKYRTLIERANDGITIIQDGILKFGNQRLGELWGGPVEEIIGRPLTDFVHPDAMQEVLERYKQRMVGGTPPPVYETILKHKDGTKFYAELNAGVIVYEEKPADLIILRDVNDRKKAEDALRESEMKYRTLVDNLNIGIFRTKYEDGGQIIEANRCAAKMLGYDSPDDLKKVKIKDIYVDSFVRDEMFSELCTKKSVKNRIVELRKRDDSTVWASLSANAQFDTNGNILWLDGIGEDITERKGAEETLRESETTARALINAMMDSVLLLDLQGVILDLNETAARRLGKLKGELIGVLADSVLPEEVAQVRRSMISLVINKKEAVRFEDDRDGIWFDTVAYPVIGADGEVTRIAIIACDITERTQAEAALKKSEKRFRDLAKMLPVEKLVPADVAVAVPGLQPTAGIAASESAVQSPEIMNLLNLSNALKKAQAGITILDLSAHCVWANDALVTMLGVGSSDAIVGKSVAQYIASELRKPVLDRFSDVKKKRGHALFPISLMTPEGRVPVEASVSIIADYSGAPVGYLAIIRHMKDNAPEGMGGKTDPKNPSIPKKGSLKHNIISSEKTTALFFTVSYILYHVFGSITCCP